MSETDSKNNEGGGDGPPEEIRGGVWGWTPTSLTPRDPDAPPAGRPPRDRPRPGDGSRTPSNAEGD